MGCKLKNRGFSLTEVLLSVGVLAVGMIFIAGVFPVGIHYTTIAIEQTKAAIVADEAFAKVRLYAVGDPFDLTDDFDPNELGGAARRGEALFDFNDSDIFPATDKIDPNEFTYPSAGADISQKWYYWSALCRLTSRYDRKSNRNPEVEVTVFVCRKIGRNPQYHDPDGSGFIDWPRPFKVDVDGGDEENELETRKFSQRTFINDGCVIVDDQTGRRYRVLERYPDDARTPEREDKIILLDRDWDRSWPGGSPQAVWVVPPPVNGGRNPCIAVYQRTIPYLGVVK
ncbi:MAG: prepilin-type N-terminal cleavage/methylation domain-containing protein [Planctomycetota bacterium]|nr:MAG: prepilin-type N-terminal cleavage/methylation domain-containing protein [Planctomycetota bacterium]